MQAPRPPKVICSTQHRTSWELGGGSDYQRYVFSCALAWSLTHSLTPDRAGKQRREDTHQPK